METYTNYSGKGKANMNSNETKNTRLQNTTPENDPMNLWERMDKRNGKSMFLSQRKYATQPGSFHNRLVFAFYGAKVNK
jgi:hypothetical protein